MRIRTQFIASCVVFAVVLFVSSAVLIAANERLQETTDQERMVRALQQNANELGFLTHSYVLFQEQSQATLWQSKMISMFRGVAAFKTGSPQQQGVVQEISASQQRLLAIFTDIQADWERDPAMVNDLDYLRIAWSRMQVQSQAIISDASRLSQLLRNQSDQIKQSHDLTVISLLAAFGLLILANLMVLNRRVVSSLSKLRAGTGIIGSGNLEYAIPDKGRDEFGDLSRAFNRMTLNLRNVTSSKSDLEKEVTERRRAEEALRESKSKLEAIFESINDAISITDTRG